MLSHIVPRKLLQGFEDQPESGTVWRFDKQTTEWSSDPLPIRVLGAENDYYTDDDERALAVEVEGPANRYIEEIRQGSPVRAEAVGLTRPESLIILPLAPGVALQWSWTGHPGSSGRVHHMAPARARSINRATVQWAERFIFARRPEAYVRERHAKNAAHDAATGRSGRYTRTTAIPSTPPAARTWAGKPPRHRSGQPDQNAR